MLLGEGFIRCAIYKSGVSEGGGSGGKFTMPNVCEYKVLLEVFSLGL